MAAAAVDTSASKLLEGSDDDDNDEKVAAAANALKEVFSPGSQSPSAASPGASGAALPHAHVLRNPPGVPLA